MPKWIAYCRQCNRPSTYSEIDPATDEQASIGPDDLPSAKKPSLPADGDHRECPFCKRESRIAHCDLTYSYM